MNRIATWWKCWQIKFVIFTTFTVLFAPLICNDQPLFCYSVDGTISFPAFQAGGKQSDRGDIEDSFVIYAPVPYSPGKSDLLNADFKSPFSQQDPAVTYLNPLRQRHWLGTDLRGSDVLTDMIFAMRSSIFISVLATLIAFFIGSLLGVVSGWNERTKFLAPTSDVAMLILGFFLLMFALTEVRSWPEKSAFLFLSGVGVVLMGRWLRVVQQKWLRKVSYLTVPVAFIVDRFSELFLAIPRLLLLVVIVQFLPRTVEFMAFAIGITAWIDLSRLIKSEVIILKEQPFIEAADMSGMKKWRLFHMHLLPNIWPSVMVVLMYIFSGNILLDASLSFLGFGLPPEILSIGGMMSTARIYYEAWWMFLFPGIWISLLIYAVFTTPEALQRISVQGD